jgi:RimJ/RimL family protein N-acetyltransferase
LAIAPAGDLGGLAGSISLLRIRWEHRRAEVGYWLAAGHRGAGHATRALQLICRWSVTALGLERIDLLAATENAASQRVAERAGFTREALLRSYMTSPGDGRWDMVAFGLLADDLSRLAGAAAAGQ